MTNNLLIIAALSICLPLSIAHADASPHAKPDGERLISSARANQSSLQSYRTVQKVATTTKGRAILSTTSVLKCGDGSVLKRREIAVDGRTRPPSITITNSEGTWELFPDAAIRRPDAIPELLDEYIESASQLHDNMRRSPPSYHVESISTNTGPITKVTMRLAEDTIKDLRTLIAARLSSPEVGELKKKTGRDLRMEDFVPAAYEYIINDDLNIIVSYATIAESGRVVDRKEYTSFTCNLNLPGSLFEIPKGVPLIFPTNSTEYNAIRAKYVENRRKNKQK